MIEPLVQKIAKSAAMVDPLDLPALVMLGELFEELCEKLEEPGLTPLNDRARRSADLLESIVMHEVVDLDETFAEINRTIEYAQEIAAAIEEGLSPDEVPLPASDGDPTPEIDTELLMSWVSGCSDILDELESLAVGLEAEIKEEALADLRRGIHTLKGECGVLSLSAAQTICHEAETLLDLTIDVGLPFPTSEILAVIDWMKGYSHLLAQNPAAAPPAHEELLRALTQNAGTGSDEPGPDVIPEPADAATQESPNPDAPGTQAEPADQAGFVVFPSTLDRDENLADFLSEAREHITSAEEAILSLESDFTDLELINTVFRAFHTIKGVAGFMNLTPIVDAAHNAEFLLDEARKQTITLNSQTLDLILESCDLMSQLLGVLDGEPAPTLNAFNFHIEQLQLASKNKPFVTQRGSTSPAAQTPTPKPVNLPTKKPQAQETAPVGGATRKKSNDVSVKVNTERLDNLVTMVGELVIAQQMVIQDPNALGIEDQRFQRNLNQTGKIIRDLQEVAMSLRMVTLKGLFQKMARLVRDVSAKADKRVQFVMEGEETELDRTVVEEIGDPLVHMIRNSCDHGIETPEERAAAGKPETGTLTLRAYHQGGSIVIEIEDDGKGLDRDKILAKAIEKGIYTPDRELDEIPDSEVFNLIMLPGFSTAAKITDISGRGVGMDVVRRNIEALRGKLEIYSVKGRGTTFKMSLPLTMAIIDGMIVRVGTQRYVIPTLSIEQSFRPTPDQVHTVAGQGEMALVRGSLLPIYRLNKIFNVSEGTNDINEGLLLVLESNDTRCCMLIDEIIGQQQVVIKRLGEGLEPLQGVSGGAILGDGKVALIIDVAGLLSEAAQFESLSGASTK